MLPIRDPVYGYIYITRIEKQIVDKPRFQRLRFVLQNSTAYLTFPNNTSTRFLHSLGVSQLSGQMFEQAVGNCKIETLCEFLEQGQHLIKDLMQTLAIDPDSLGMLIQKELENSRDDVPMLRHRQAENSEVLKKEHGRVFYVLWQSLRLCALIHDIGHLPLSHVFEHALSDYNSLGEKSTTPVINKYTELFNEFRSSLGKELAEDLGEKVFDTPPHELLGLSIFAKLFPPTGDELPRLMWRLANIMFLLNPRESLEPRTADRFQLLRCMHTIVASPLDADRMDYCVRDPYVSGLELGAIDVKRIVSSMVLHKKHGHFRILPKATALPAIESFFHQRFLIYKNLVYDHNVVRMNGVAKEILVRLLRATEPIAGEPAPIISDELRISGFWGENNENRWLCGKNFEHCDDGWLRELFSVLHQKLQATRAGTHKARNNADGSPIKGLTDSEEELFLLLDTLLYPKTENLWSVWVDEIDYYATVRDSSNDYVAWPEGQKPRRNPLAVERGDPKWNSTVQDLRNELAVMNVCLIYEYLEPKTVIKGAAGPHMGPEMLANDKEVFMLEVCPYLRMLNDAALEVPNVHLSLLGTNLASTNNTVREKAMELALGKIKAYVKDVMNEQVSAASVAS